MPYRAFQRGEKDNNRRHEQQEKNPRRLK